MSKTFLPSKFALISDKPILFHVLFILSYEFTPNPIRPLVLRVSEIKRLLEIFVIFRFLKLEFEPLIEFCGISL